MRFQTRHLLHAMTGVALFLVLTPILPGLALFCLSALVTMAVPMLVALIVGAFKQGSLTGGVNSFTAGLFIWVVVLGVVVVAGGFIAWWELS